MSATVEAPAPRAPAPVGPPLLEIRGLRVSEDDRGLLTRDPLAAPPPGLDDPPPEFPD